jgi:hypothetical protein
LAQQIENISNRAALVRRLKDDPVFRFSCGFKVTGKVPSESTLSKYYNKLTEENSLEKLYYELVDQDIESEIIDTETS